LSCLSVYTKQIEHGYLIDNQIISKIFFIPYLYCQGAYDDIDVCFMVELFYNSTKFFECEFQFELFNDNNDEKILKKIKWKPSYTHDKYTEHYFNCISSKDCYILEDKIIIMFDVDL
jgi:hypothetical protein